MKSSRRGFLKITGATAVGLGSMQVAGSFASSGTDDSVATKTSKNSAALTAKHWAMVIDTRKFHSAEDLEPMIEACDKAHNIPKHDDKNHEIKWLWKDEFKHVFPTIDDTYLNDRIKHLPFLVLCNHCEEPACCRACPTQATFKRDDGIVLMDFHRCIGCRFCMAACPYGSRSFNFKDPRPAIKHMNPEFPTRMMGVVEKCNFCAERLAVGKMPACVEASKGAILFGDLKDSESNVRKALKENYTIRRKLQLGASPAVYYIV